MKNICELYETKTGYVAGKWGRTWLNLYGKNLSETLIVIHGGPGSSHFSMSPLRELSRQIPVLFYDQIGSGLSDSPKNLRYATVGTFVEEIETLRQFLEIKRLCLLGHSWGAVPALMYWKKYERFVSRIIFSSPLINTSRWESDVMGLAMKLPLSHRRAILRADKTGNYEVQAYKGAVSEFWKRYVYRKTSRSREMLAGNGVKNGKLYLKMWGPSEMKCNGTLKRFDGEPLLSQITVPTLFVCGQYDEARPDTVRYFSSLVPCSNVRVIKGCAHIAYQENSKAYISAIENFLSSS